MGAINVVFAPALSRAVRGATSSICSKPSVARIATRTPFRMFSTMRISFPTASTGLLTATKSGSTYVAWDAWFEQPGKHLRREVPGPDVRGYLLAVASLDKSGYGRRPA